jgi:mannosyltransferase OCH1-like enzyme
VTAQQFIATHFGTDLVRAYKTCSAPALKSDLFRLAFLYQCGGVYADCDDKCQDALEGLFKPGYSLVVQQEIGSTIGNNLIGVTARHPFVKNALAWVASLILEQQGHTIRFVSGPGMLTKAFCDTYLAQFARGTLPAGVKVLCPHDLAAFVAQHLPREFDHVSKVIS